MRNLDRIQVDYKKVKVSEAKKTKHYIQLQKLKELSPYGSRINVHFEPSNGFIRGSLTVTSKRHKFDALALYPDLDMSMKQLIKDVNAQILDWKRNRFSGGTPGQLQPAITA